MRLHPRLFNRFLTVAAAISVVAIIGFGFRHAGNQERGFRANLGDGRALLDSLAAMPDSRPLTVLFWASWSAPSVALLQELSRDTSHVLIAAYVRDDSTSVSQAVAGSSVANLRLINGTAVFQSLKTPGIPTLVRYGEDGRLVEVVVGRP